MASFVGTNTQVEPPTGRRPWRRKLHLDESHLISRHASKLRSSASFAGLLGITIISLAIVYLVFRCFRQHSHKAGAGDARRMLAAGGADQDDYCTPTTESSWDSDVFGYALEPGTDTSVSEEVALGIGESPTGITPPRYSQGEPSEEGAAPTGAYRQLAPNAERSMKALLRSLRDNVATGAEYIRCLEPLQAVVMATHLARLGVIEVSSLAIVPDNLQGLRAQVALGYVSMVQSIMNTEVTWWAANVLGTAVELNDLRTLLVNVTGVPPPTENLDGASYGHYMISQNHLAIYANTQAMKALSELVSVQGGLGDLIQQTQTTVRVLEAIFNQRKQQALRISVIRRWLHGLQKHVHPWLLYTRFEYYAWPTLTLGTPTEQLVDLSKAVFEARRSARSPRWSASQLDTSHGNQSSQQGSHAASPDHLSEQSETSPVEISQPGSSSEAQTRPPPGFAPLPHNRLPSWLLAEAKNPVAAFGEEAFWQAPDDPALQRSQADPFPISMQPGSKFRFRTSTPIEQLSQQMQQAEDAPSQSPHVWHRKDRRLPPSPRSKNLSTLIGKDFPFFLPANLWSADTHAMKKGARQRKTANAHRVQINDDEDLDLAKLLEESIDWDEAIKEEQSHKAGEDLGASKLAL